MFSMNWFNMVCIIFGIKIATLRNLNSKFKIGSIQMLKIGQFDFFYYAKVKIISKEVINIDELSIDEFRKLGYKNKEEYMKEEFNKNNSSKLRIKYEFEVIEVIEELFEGII